MVSKDINDLILRVHISTFGFSLKARAGYLSYFSLFDLKFKILNKAFIAHNMVLGTAWSLGADIVKKWLATYSARLLRNFVRFSPDVNYFSDVEQRLLI